MTMSLLQKRAEVRNGAPATRRAILDLILEDPDRVLEESFESLAERSRSSVPTIMRTCRDLGFAGLREFKLALARAQELALGGSPLHRRVNVDDAADEVVAKMTARKLRIADRGLLRVGAFADVVGFDPATIADTATYDQPRSASRGIERVFVNGVCAFRGNGEEPEMLARAGRMLTRAAKGKAEKAVTQVAVPPRVLFAPLGAFFLSSGVANPIGRRGASGGVISTRRASNTCLSWLRVLRLKLSCRMSSSSAFSSSASRRLARSRWSSAISRSRTKARTT
jgi:hypothetical protein